MLSDNKRQAALLSRLLSTALAGRGSVERVAHLGHGTGLTHEAVLLTTPERERPITLLPVPTGTGYPQDIKRTLATIDGIDAREVPVLVARRMSPGARELLDDARLNWADEAGNLRIVTGSAVILLEVPPAQAPESMPDEAMRWADAAGAIAELILGDVSRANEDEPLAGVTTIAARLGVSAPLVSRVLQRFDEAGWTRKSGAERGPLALRHAVDPGAMLSSWAGWRSAQRRTTTVAHTLMPDVDAWLAGIRQSWPAGAWALTGEAAAEVRAPYLSRVSLVEIYVEQTAYDDDLDRMLAQASLDRVPSGGRVQVIRSDPYLFNLVQENPANDDVPLVPDVRLYADLLAGGVRGADAASELRDRRIGF